MPQRPPRHRPLTARPKRDDRARAHTRGYDAAWRRFRFHYAGVCPPICVDCGYAGASREMELDHITPLDAGGAKFDASNLAWRCGQRALSGNFCHAKKTAADPRL